MVAAHDGAQVLAGPLHAFIGSGPITDHIATAEDLIVVALGLVQDGLEGVDVGMYVAKDEKTQGVASSSLLREWLEAVAASLQWFDVISCCGLRRV